MLAFNSAPARQYNLNTGQQVEVARDESKTGSDNLYIIFTGRKTTASRTITGKPNYPGIAVKAILNALGMDSESNRYEYTITGKLEYEGKRVLELELEKKSPRDKKK